MDSENRFLRRGHAPARRGRASPWRRPLFFCGVLLLATVGLLRFLGGSLFAVRRFEISGNGRVRTEEIWKALEPWRGSNLVMLDLAPVADCLARKPWIERVTVAKRFPDGLSVRCVEWRAVALLRDGRQLLWLNPYGAPIAPYDPKTDHADSVLVTADRRVLPELVGLLEDLRLRRPDYLSALSEIAALPDGGFGMMDSIFRRPIRVLRRDAPEKIGALLRARSLIESRGWEARAIDLRFADQIVLEGAYGVGNSL